MPDGTSPFPASFDWDEYWRTWDGESDEDYTASVSGGHFDRLERFFERTGVPADAAFVGCGPGILANAVAAAHPGTQVVGYDAAEIVITRNREVHSDRPNVSFGIAVLPEFEVERWFELVFCYATLHYVRDSERAVENLYRRVRPGGHLVCNYPNEAYREDHREVTGKLRERLKLPIEGENLLSRPRINEILGADTRNSWELVDAEGPFVRPSNPCVVVEK